MCDLIDLNSPNMKGLVNLKLASPLIPMPKNVECKKQTVSLVTEKRESLGSNPFDSLLQETTEYIKKKGDPFEVILQRALKSKSEKDTQLKAQSVDFMDDFTPRRKKYQKMMNKTLNESLIEDNADSIKEKKEEDSVAVNNANVACDSNTVESNKFILEQNTKIMVDADPLELSILSQSVMNDTLLEVGSKQKVDNEISIFLKTDPLFKEFVLPTSSNLKPQCNFQRSLSQGDRSSAEKLQCQNKRSQSITDMLTTTQCDNTMLSFLNKGFLESKDSQQSVFSNLSDVSPMTRLADSSVSHLSSVSTNGITNNAFMDSNYSKMSHEKMNTTENSMEIKSVQYDLSDLTERLNKLKCAIDRTTSTLSTKEEIDKSNSMKEENNKQITNDKLIDVDIFLPEPSFNQEHNTSTNSTTSSDSVFSNNGKIDKSILNEAKVLARTFEELASRTDSGSSTDDLISNNHLWISELLPAYEDEAVDDLIELLVSPKKHLNVDKTNDLKQFASIDNMEEKHFMKEMEPQFDNVSTVRQTMVTTLLLDLKKLVKEENNPEANKLIDNLGNVLGVECKNNTELLASLNISTELQNSKMSDDKLDNIEQSSKTNNGKSQKENKQVLSNEEICDESSLPHISNKSIDTSQATNSSSDNSLVETLSCNNNNENCLNITNSPNTNLKDSHLDKKLAVELLINLGKLLSGQTENTAILQLLKSIGKALDVASNNYKTEGELHTGDNSCNNTKQITFVETSESERNAPISKSKDATHEQSFSSKYKPLEKTRRRSISAINSSNANTSNMQVNEKRRSTSGLKDEKRLSNSSKLINTVANKKIPILGASNMRTVETAAHDSNNEKSLAIIDVKNKLKKKLNIVSNKGPMKAVHPVGAMQKKASFGKQTALSSEITTPPKSHAAASGGKIISSTPNSLASSTPDGQNNGSSKMQLTSGNKKRNFSCDISPVTTQNRGSPGRPSKPPIIKKSTPKRQQVDLSGIPKYCTPPRKLNSSFDMNSHRQQSPQYLNKSLTSYQRHSPIRPKSAEKKLRSPLKDSNKIFTKVKPFKLISKLKGSNTSDLTEKENYSE